MNAKTIRILLSLIGLLLVLGLSACIPGITYFPEQQDAGAIYTAAAQTVSVKFTQSAGATAVAQLTQIAQATPIAGLPSEIPTEEQLPPPPTDTPTPTATLPPVIIPPTATPVPTAVPPTATRKPPTAVPAPCDWARFVKDVTIPDQTTLAPGSAFTKIWRIQNSGSCTWNASYSLVFASGDRLQAKSTIPLPGIVRPGESVDLSADMVAPANTGSYRGYWMLSNTNGRNFGIGTYADKPFWVDIRVVGSNSQASYDFVANMCLASWRSSARSLPCPGNSKSADGSVASLNKPFMETGKQAKVQALWTRPEEVKDGWIQGVYPSYKVQNRDHFVADIGCLEDSPGCQVDFYLNYQVQGQAVKSMGVWDEAFDGSLTHIDVDLSGLAGKQVTFILSVANNGKPARANAIWLAPMIQSGNIIPQEDWDTIPAVKAARQKLAKKLGLKLSQVDVVYVEAVDWPDACLGTNPPGQVCKKIIVPGYRVILWANNRQYEAHTNKDGSIVVWA